MMATEPATLLQRVSAGLGQLAVLAILVATGWVWLAILLSPTGASPVPTCVCPRDNGRPPSRQPTEDDYYTRPPGVNYEPQ